MGFGILILIFAIVLVVMSVLALKKRRDHADGDERPPESRRENPNP